MIVCAKETPQTKDKTDWKLPMYHLIVNKKNHGKDVEEKLGTVKNVFEKAGKQLVIHETLHQGHAKEIAAELTANGDTVNLIAMGGDGTLHEVLNGIKNVSGCTLGLIPLGSGNDFAECAHISKDVKTAAETIAFRSPTRIDFIELDNGLRSINAVGMGIDVDVLKRVYGGKKTGKNKYFSAFIKSLMHYKPGSYKVVYDGKEEQHSGIIVCLGNGRQIGGGIKVFPEADITDGYIDLLMVDCLTRFRTLIAFMKLNAGKVNKIKEVTHVLCKSVCVTPLNGTATTIQAEGELYEGVPLNAQIAEGKLSFYLPEND